MKATANETTTTRLKRKCIHFILTLRLHCGNFCGLIFKRWTECAHKQNSCFLSCLCENRLFSHHSIYIIEQQSKSCWLSLLNDAIIIFICFMRYTEKKRERARKNIATKFNDPKQPEHFFTHFTLFNKIMFIHLSTVSF